MSAVCSGLFCWCWSVSCLLADDEAAKAQDRTRSCLWQIDVGATLEGQFTARDKGDGKLPNPEKYTLGTVTKVKDDLWTFQTRISNGNHDVQVPLTLRVIWAGDTPVITLDKLDVPGLGKFTARVMIFNRQYSGMWDGGGNHGGLLFGRVIPAKETPK